MKTLFLYPGQLVASAEPMRVTTILGSCVGIAFHDPKTQVGGLCHYILVDPPTGERPSGRYASYAVPRLLEDIERRGGDLKRLQAKVYGGASVLAKETVNSVGTRNIEYARNFLRERHIPVIEEKVGGVRGCKIEFETHTFSVYHRVNAKEKDDTDIVGRHRLEAKKVAKVLVVDDSATVRRMLTLALSKHPQIKVVGAASDAYEAREMLVKFEPDVLTLDIEMPKMNGVVFLEKVMKHAPTPVIMVSSLGAHEMAAQRALELGAVEFVHKPHQFDPASLHNLGTSIIGKIIAAASLSKSDLERLAGKAKTASSVSTSTASVLSSARGPTAMDVIGISGNVGSADDLVKILSGLQHDTPPVVVALPTISGFIQAFIEKNKSACKVRLTPALDGQALFAGHVYFAPATHHVLAQPTSGGAKIVFSSDATLCHGQKPSGSKLFDSLAKGFGARGCAILLSGFGNDGVDEFGQIHQAGGVTIAQSPDSATFPNNIIQAVEAGTAEHVVPPAAIAETIRAIRSARLVA